MKRHISILLLSIATLSCSKKTPEPTPTPVIKETVNKVTAEEIPDSNPLRPFTPEETAESLGMTTDFSNADDYMKNLVQMIDLAQKNHDSQLIEQVLGQHSLTPDQAILLKKLIEDDELTVDELTPLLHIGELKSNKHARWAINLKKNSPIVLDLKRDASGNWKADKIVLPETSTTEGSPAPQLPNLQKDALNYTHTFLTHLLKQDFQKSKSMINSSNITDAKLAALCIIFEEAAYTIDIEKPLRAIFMRDTAAGFYANVVSNTGEKAAQFSIIAQRESAEHSWEIYEINLDQLLGDYANRVSGGDTHYTPLLKNPAGGDSLVIYFEFDSEGLTPRTKKQLDIVSNILQLDKKNTITISGHTDSKGAADYNATLSNKRAQSVKDYFANHGVSPNQVVIESHGAQIPRRPNTKVDGSDNPEGRRANRRTEIYLDF